MLQLDNAGWHGEAGLAIPEGIRPVYLPAYSPELQPAETLWALVEEPIVNQHIPTIRGAGTNYRATVCRFGGDAGSDQIANAVSLVAGKRCAEVISRSSYHFVTLLLIGEARAWELAPFATAHSTNYDAVTREQAGPDRPRSRSVVLTPTSSPTMAIAWPDRPKS